VPAVTIKGYELLSADSKVSTVQKIRRALESAGIEFIDATGGKGPGVRYAKDGESKRR
jgi:hypothetical protein